MVFLSANSGTLFCDVDCDATPRRFGANHPLGTDAHGCSVMRRILADASEAPVSKGAWCSPRSVEIGQGQRAMTIHTQEVFPVAFTASTSSAMRPGQRVRHQTKCKNYVFRLP